jgi:hypothetical protein
VRFARDGLNRLHRRPVTAGEKGTATKRARRETNATSDRETPNRNRDPDKHMDTWMWKKDGKVATTGGKHRRGSFKK